MYKGLNFPGVYKSKHPTATDALNMENIRTVSERFKVNTFIACATPARANLGVDLK